MRFPDMTGFADVFRKLYPGLQVRRLQKQKTKARFSAKSAPRNA